jgi:alanine racemase
MVGILAEANVLMTPDVLEALQKIASSHRHMYQYPVIGITGSNGKTIVKEWLYQLYIRKFNVAHSPKSYKFAGRCSLKCMANEFIHDLGIF